MRQVIPKASSAELQAYYDLLLAAFQRACDQSPGPAEVYQFNGCRVGIRFAGPGLASMLGSAIAHARLPAGAVPEYRILAWDSASSGAGLPYLLDQHIELLRREWGTLLDSRGGVRHLSGDEVTSTLHMGASGVCLSVYHSRQRQAIFWTGDAAVLPYYEQGAPFRTILNWMINDDNHIVVHAGAVGLPDRGVLLAGKGGTGKSTTALACLKAGLSYASDDYCLVELGETKAAHCLYNTAKVVRMEELERFPALAGQFELRDPRDPRSKPMTFLHQHRPAQVVNRLPLFAILLPRITGEAHTLIRPADAGAAFAAIAPNSIFQLPGAGKSTMAAIGRLAKSLPSFWLELGTDLDEIPGVISRFLQEAPGV